MKIVVVLPEDGDCIVFEYTISILKKIIKACCEAEDYNSGWMEDVKSAKVICKNPNVTLQELEDFITDNCPNSNERIFFKELAKDCDLSNNPFT